MEEISNELKNVHLSRVVLNYNQAFSITLNLDKGQLDRYP
jgi:hypothetical protein